MACPSPCGPAGLLLEGGKGDNMEVSKLSFSDAGVFVCEVEE